MCNHYDMCGDCESKGLHPAHDMVRIPAPRTYPPHFFTRLHRLYERCTHASPTLTKPGCGSLSSPNEQMARDLLEEDSSDISDLELEISLAPDVSAGFGSTLLARKRYNSDPGNCSGLAGKISPLDTSNSIMMKEQLPSFEELTRSMQDLAEKDLDEYTDDNKICFQSRNEDIGNLGILSVDLKQSETYKQNKSSGDVARENKVQASKQNNNEEEILDTSESLRNIQQEIESLLAPLTPLPDLDPIPKAVKRGDEKETFVLMNLKNEKSRASSFEIVESNVKDVVKSNSMDDWSFLGDKHINNIQNKIVKQAGNEEAEDESSETETEDQVESDGDCNGNVPAKEVKSESDDDLQSSISQNNELKKDKTISEAQIKEPDISEVHGPSKLENNFSAGLSGIVGGTSLLRYHQWQQKQSARDERKENELPKSGSRQHYNPKISDAVDKMVGMGFTDDDGWLTQLLVMKHGDISEVLDILTPVKK